MGAHTQVPGQDRDRYIDALDLVCSRTRAVRKTLVLAPLLTVATGDGLRL